MLQDSSNLFATVTRIRCGAAPCSRNSLLSSFSYFHRDSIPLSNYAIEFPGIFRITRKRDSTHEIRDVMERIRNPATLIVHGTQITWKKMIKLRITKLCVRLSLYFAQRTIMRLLLFKTRETMFELHQLRNPSAVNF